ncbi:MULTISPECIES: IS66 family transposase [unclassified Rhizobium]|uniref:IS66 family transposase n=1 Tax=unclassified Rhizobium TaxID=2613769 RepID=UPI001C82DCD0|nr:MULTISPECIES: IS66 family transposase [unclassified Rhizobium]MBX5165241.1 IS66 family transposase [Rhizobium sp. NZLR4b]MBX5172821.1 IS66 family transposase [Rhizobium sp. NZLR1b]MBX5185091.1 IS66 family transposase [Rhizobium sp. NZLR5]MBX5208951.1 IS66 family transposase [Rhizobium sp. NZLR11]
MTIRADELPDDLNALKAMVLSREAENARLRQIIKELQRHRFGRRAETLPEDQLLLGLEEAEQVEADGLEEKEQASTDLRQTRVAKRRTNRGSLPAHLPRIEMVVDIDDHACPGCHHDLHRIGEDISEKLDIVPAQFRVLVVRRPKYGCRACEDVVVQAPAPARLIERGIPTEATVAQVLVSKYADHLPLYRQAQIYKRQGIDLDRSTLADWVGRAAWHLRPVHQRLLDVLKTSSKLFADETTAPVLDPGRGKTKTGQLWAYARDDRPWQGSDPPGVVYIYAPDRKAERPMTHLEGFVGVLQVDGYSGYRPLAAKNAVSLAFCWSHVRRRFYELAAAGPAPIATEALRRIAELYRTEDDIRGRAQDERRAVRQEKSRPITDSLASWLTEQLGLISQKTKLAEAIRYTLSRWDGLTRFIDDGRIEIDSNAVERSIRPIALNRKNALFAGSDAGAEHWATIALLIETAKLNDVEPLGYLIDVLTKIVNGHPNSQIDTLLPWAYLSEHNLSRKMKAPR